MSLLSTYRVMCDMCACNTSGHAYSKSDACDVAQYEGWFSGRRQGEFVDLCQDCVNVVDRKEGEG